ncbi:retrotransposon protein, putative, ty1-copia subclass [Tanacetum coccineum]
MDGHSHTFKDRLVAKGYTQTYRVDYGETFSPVADIRAIRILLAIVTFYDYEIWQMDVKTAFLNDHLSEDNKRLDEEIKKIGFTQNPDESCVYLKASGSNVAFLVMYVDDILLMGHSVTMLKDVKSWLYKCFSMKDLEEATYILGIRIIRDKSKRLIALSQSAYLEKNLKKFRMENSKKGYTPMIEKHDYKKSQCAKIPTEFLNWTNGTIQISNGLCVRAMVERWTEGVQSKALLMLSSTEVECTHSPSNKGFGDVMCHEACISYPSESGILMGIFIEPFSREKYHYIHEVIQEGEIVLKKVHTDDNIANPFTKPMSFNKHFEHAMAIGIVLASSLM